MTSLTTQLLALFALFTIIGTSARWIIDSLMVMGRRMRIGGFFIGFILLGLFTSVPEFLVAMNAIADEVPTLSLGNLIGASVVLLTLVNGASIVLRGSVCVLCMIHWKSLVAFAAIILLPIALAADRTLSAADGVALIVAYLAYALFMLNREHLYDVPAVVSESRSVRWALGTFVVAIVVLIVASQHVVDLGRTTATALGVSPLLFGLVAFSIGTNLPEVALAWVARRATQRGFVFGDILGSAAVNSLIIGILAVMRPFSIADAGPFWAASVFLAAALALFLWFSRTQRRLKPREGFILVGVYVAFVGVLILFGASGMLAP